MLELFDGAGEPVPFGWRRDMATNTVLSTKPGGQADLAGVKKNWVFDAIDGTKVVDDESFEAAMAAAKAAAAGKPNSLVTVSFRVTTDLRFEKETFSIASAAALAGRTRASAAEARAVSRCEPADALSRALRLQPPPSAPPYRYSSHCSSEHAS